MSLISLLSALTLFVASAIPFYFTTKVDQGPYFLLSLLLGLTLLVHGLHHALEFVGWILASLAAGVVSAVIALAFGIQYYLTWRGSSG